MLLHRDFEVADQGGRNLLERGLLQRIRMSMISRQRFVW